MNICYAFGTKLKEKFTNLTEETIYNENQVFQIDLINKMKMGMKIAKLSASVNTILILTKNGKVYSLNRDKEMEQIKLDGEEKIYHIASGYCHHVVSTESKVYTWFDKVNSIKNHGQLGRSFTTTSKFEPNPIHQEFFFPRVTAAKYNTFVKDQRSWRLFVCGKCKFLEFGLAVDSDKVEFLTEILSYHYQKLPSHLNESFFLLGNPQIGCCTLSIKKKIIQFNLSLGLSTKQSISFTKNNVLYSKATTQEENTLRFIEVSNPGKVLWRYRRINVKIKNPSKIKKIIGSDYCFFILLEDMSLYKIESLEAYNKLNLPKAEHICTFQGRKFIDIIPAHGNGFIIIFQDSLAPEVFDLFKKKKLTDLKLRNQKVHKLLFSFRIGLPPNIFIDIIENKLIDKQFQHLLLWIYTGLIRDWDIMQNVFVLLKIKNIFKKDFRIDLNTLAVTDSTKDFNLIVKKKSLKIHKLILTARSELFFSMFELIDENEKSVHDYSERSYRSLKIIIHFLYTNQFLLDEFNKEKDLIKLFQDLEDAQDFYQISVESKFTKKLTKVKIMYQKQLDKQKKLLENKKKNKK
ncbi:btk-binding protein-related [Anaeramoeba flamelloides]|uniref:Btk-binding protein-related n=1 Tax=Anaeramoeba flamelloides TaxID=1746091 RepID=A0AAV7Z2R2_9EUKA|nr:btk-binding protein-related [Anaeramoeba flamelloides]